MKKLLLIIFLVASISGSAQDRYFARAYNSNILPQHAIDIEGSYTSRFGREAQFYFAQDQRLEVEIGLGNNIQTSFYFNRYEQRTSTGPDGTVVSNETGFSNEWKWRFTRPLTKTAMAIYSEWGIKGGDELELETKFIADRNIGKNLFTCNVTIEFEKEFVWENGSVRHKGFESPVEINLAWMYHLHSSLGIGLELVDMNGVGSDHGWEYSLLFAGPTINYRGNGWFVIGNYLPQLRNLHTTSFAPGHLVLDEHERAEARIILGISLR